MNLLRVMFSLYLCTSLGNAKIFYTDTDSNAGTWSTWFNTDNPSIFHRHDPGGDIESMSHILEREGNHCDWGVQCKFPIAMEVALSNKHKITYKDANLDEVLNCTYIRPEAMKPENGFYCMNKDQQNMNHSPECLKNCRRNGQMDFGNQQYWEETEVDDNCNICADFQVRFFCRDRDKDCTTAEEWLQILKDLEIYLENEIHRGSDNEPATVHQPKEQKRRETKSLWERLLLELEEE